MLLEELAPVKGKEWGRRGPPLILQLSRVLVMLLKVNSSTYVLYAHQYDLGAYSERYQIFGVCFHPMCTARSLSTLI